MALVILLAALEVPAAWPADDSKDPAKSAAQNSSQAQAPPELAELRSLKEQIEGMRADILLAYRRPHGRCAGKTVTILCETLWATPNLPEP